MNGNQPKEQNSIPTSKAQRSAKFVKTGFKIGGNYIKHYSKKLFNPELDKTELNENNAADIYESLSELKGSALKVAQMLSMEGEDVEGQGTNLRIRLTSLWPINKANGPTDDFERVGLQRVAQEPQKPYTGIITQGERRIFKAIYADRAVTKTCVECHNGHLASSKRDFKLYDVMGAIVISFPAR